MIQKNTVFEQCFHALHTLQKTCINGMLNKALKIIGKYLHGPCRQGKSPVFDRVGLIILLLLWVSSFG